MSAPFQPGDVVCVINDSPARWHEPKGECLTVGDVFRVARFVRGMPFGPAFPRSFIVRVGDSKGILGWDAYRFRKIDAADEQFTAQVRACKPVKVRA